MHIRILYTIVYYYLYYYLIKSDVHAPIELIFQLEAYVQHHTIDKKKNWKHNRYNPYTIVLVAELNPCDSPCFCCAKCLCLLAYVSKPNTQKLIQKPSPSSIIQLGLLAAAFANWHCSVGRLVFHSGRAAAAAVAVAPDKNTLNFAVRIRSQSALSFKHSLGIRMAD